MIRILAAWLCALVVHASARERVYVFAPSLLRPAAVQAVLAARCPGQEITVFGRLADLSSRMRVAPPDALVAPSYLLDRFPEMRPFLRGLRDGSPDEPAVLLSLEATLDPRTLDGVEIGLLGVLERSELEHRADSLLGARARYKIVTKLEDLLPLLVFRSARAALLGADAARQLQARSQARLAVAPLPGVRLGLVAVGARNPDTARRVALALRNLEPSEREMLGVDAWTR